MGAVEHAGQPFDGVRHAGAVEGGEHQVAGFRGAECRGGGLGIADLADQDDIGALAQRGAQGDVEVAGVAPDLALGKPGALVLEKVFDRVFQGHHVAGLVAVDPLEAGGQRGRFAGTGWSGDQHQPGAALHPGREQALRQAEFGKVGNLALDGPEGQCQPAERAEGVDPQATGMVDAQAGIAIGELVGINPAFPPDLRDCLSGNRAAVGNDDLPVASDPGAFAFGQKNVAGAAGEGVFNEGSDLGVHDG